MNDPTQVAPERAALRHLMSAYFHQDFKDEFDGRWESNVDDFIRRSPGQVADAAAQALDLLRECGTDHELATALDHLGNYRHAGDQPDAYAS